MGKFVYIYTGGALASTQEEQEKSMQEWVAWFGTLGDAVVEMGNPFGASATVKSGGHSSGGTSGATGYSVVEAGSLDGANEKAAGCPILKSGGAVEVYEALEM